MTLANLQSIVYNEALLCSILSWLMAQLIKTISLINEALKTIYEEMHEDDYMNINADIETLQTLLKKDGLTEDPFKK